MSGSASYDLDDVEPEPVDDEQDTAANDGEATRQPNRQPNTENNSGGFGLSFGLSRRQILIIAAVVLVALLVYQRSQTDGSGGGAVSEASSTTEPEEIEVPEGDQTEKDAAVMDQLHEQGVLDASSDTTEAEG